MDMNACSGKWSETMGKLFLACLVLVLILVPGGIGAAPGNCTANPSLTSMPGSFEQITVSTTSIGFTAANYAPTGSSPADLAVVDVETNAIRYRVDGLAPTASVGAPVAAATSFTVCGAANIARIRFIRQTADATLSVNYYRGE